MTVLGYCEPPRNRSRRLPLQFRYRHKEMGKKAGKDGGRSEAGKESTRFGTRKRKQYVCEITYPLRAMVLTQLSRLLEQNRHHRSRNFLCPTSYDRAANEPFLTLPSLYGGAAVSDAKRKEQ